MIKDELVSDPKEPLTDDERKTLLRLARQAMELGVLGKELPPLDLKKLTQRLRQPGASFVTLTIDGNLRGCVGALEATQPLAEDVRIHAIAAALQDYRFPAVTPEEVPLIKIEVSCLTPLQKLEYTNPKELISRLRPGIDGVVLSDGIRRATFLPQVWKKVPEAEIFLNMLCEKMGAYPDLWRRKLLDVYTYQVEEFHE